MRLLLLALAVLLVSCEPQSSGPPVVVFAAGDGDGRLADLLGDYASETGIPLDVTWGSSGELADSLIEKTGRPADVLLTDNVADIWRAADRGALRPIRSGALDSQQDFLKDPDRYWVALRAKHLAIFHGPNARESLASLDELGGQELAGRVCMSSPEIPSNRALISYLIQDRGAKEAERLVRHWVRNLARPPFDTREQLIEALRSGECDYAISVWTDECSDELACLVEQNYIDIDAVGVGRHAGNAEGAQAMVHWLLENGAVAFRSPFDTYPTPVVTAGWRDEEARQLAERAGYR